MVLQQVTASDAARTAGNDPRCSNRIACRGIVAMLATLVLCRVVAPQSAPPAEPAGFHLLLRPEGGKTTYKLGEPINFEVSCYSDSPQRYASTCPDTDDVSTELEVIAMDPTSKLALDPVETQWIGVTLCPSPQYLADNLTGESKFPVLGAEAHWRRMLLSEHYPLSAGQFRIRAATRGSTLPGNEGFTANSMPVEVTVVDDPEWRAATLREAMQAVKRLDPLAPASASNLEYAKVGFMPDTEALRWLISENGYTFEARVYPDRATIAKLLRGYLDTKVGNDLSLRETIEAVLALELAVGSPPLYRRAVAFQGALGKPSSDDLRDLRAWLLPRYRQLLLEVARSMVTTHKRAPGSYEDNNLELKAEDLVSVNVPECSTTPNFLSESELRHSMRGAGLSSKFITGQIAEMRRARAEQQKAE